jgi:hypothetical protein
MGAANFRFTIGTGWRVRVKSEKSMRTISNDWLRWVYMEIKAGRTPTAFNDDEKFYIARVAVWVADDNPYE